MLLRLIIAFTFVVLGSIVFSVPQSQTHAQSCGEAALECWMAPGPCEQVQCARRNMVRCPNRYDEIRQIIVEKQAQCEALNRNVSGPQPNWSQGFWNDSMDKLGDVVDRISGTNTNWQRNQELQRQVSNIRNGLYYYRNGVAAGGAVIAFTGAVFVLSLPWAIGFGAVGVVVGYYTPDMFGAVTERMFGG